MNHTYVQLELFNIPGIVIDEAFGAEMTPMLMKHLQDRTKRITHAVIHPSTLSLHIPDLSNRASWNADVLGDVNVNKKRMKTFNRSMTCACCGREGNVFVVEEDVNSPQTKKYLNLYHVSDEVIVEMTVDHTLPQSFGGADVQPNRETMCFVCNQDKANVMSFAEIETVLKNVKKYVKAWANVEYVTVLLKMHLLLNEATDPDKRRLIKGLLNRFLSTVQPATSPGKYGSRLKQLKAHYESLTRPLVAPAPVVVKSSWFDNIVAYIQTMLGVKNGKGS